MPDGSVDPGNIDSSEWPAFLAGLTSAFTLSTSNQTLPMATEVFDNTGDYDPTTYTFTAPIDGNYEFNATALGSNSSSGRLILGIEINGSTVYSGTQSTDTFSSGTVGVLLSLSATDTVKLVGKCNGISSIPLVTGTTNTRFWGKLVP